LVQKKNREKRTAPEKEKWQNGVGAICRGKEPLRKKQKKIPLLATFEREEAVKEKKGGSARKRFLYIQLIIRGKAAWRQILENKKRKENQGRGESMLYL